MCISNLVMKQIYEKKQHIQPVPTSWMCYFELFDVAVTLYLYTI